MSFDKLLPEAADLQSRAIRFAVQRQELEPEYASHGVESYYANIVELIKPFAGMPDPAGYIAPIDELRLALAKLAVHAESRDPIDRRDTYYANPVLARITTASDYLEDWTGKAAMEFKGDFLDPFPAWCGNQFMLTAVAKSALEAHQSMWTSARHDIDHIVHATIDALENQACCDPNRWTVTFTVVASVAAVAAVPLAAVSMGAGLAVTAVGATSQVIAASPPQPPKVEYTGETVKQIIDQMKLAVIRLADEIGNAEAVIRRALDQTNQQLSTFRNTFVAKRPALADASPGNVTGPDFMGTS